MNWPDPAGAAPSPHDDVVSAMSELIALFTECGEPEPAAWLDRQLTAWRHPEATPADRVEVARVLHRAIPGMGGLTDIYLTGGAQGTDREVNRRRDDLAQRLYDLTAPPA